MTKEDLMELLTQSGLETEQIVALLNEVIADLSGAEAPMDENPEEEKAQVMEMLGAN